MDIDTTYDEVSRRYPKAVEELLAKLRAGTSKSRDMRPEDMKWRFSWGVRISGKQVKKGPLEDRVQDEVRRSMVGIRMSAGRWFGGVPIDDVPHEVVAVIRRGHEQEMAEERRVAKLTPAERRQEVEDLLQQLSGMGGFAIVTGPPPQKKRKK